LGDLIFDRENELKIEKFQLGWKLDSKKFPMSYLAPNLDIRNAFKSHLEKGMAHWGGAVHWEKFSSVNLHWHSALGRRGALG